MPLRMMERVLAMEAPRTLAAGSGLERIGLDVAHGRALQAGTSHSLINKMPNSGYRKSQ